MNVVYSESFRNMYISYTLSIHDVWNSRLDDLFVEN